MVDLNTRVEVRLKVDFVNTKLLKLYLSGHSKGYIKVVYKKAGV